MYKQSPGRNHRSKGVKLKHVLQVCLLLAVCFWLIYQVKRSHDKKKEFDEIDAKFPVKTESSNELVKLGRKDLHPRIEGLDSVNEKHREEPEDETVEEEEEGIKPEEEDPEMEDNAKEKNDALNEDGEDEVDGHDHDQEKSDLEVDQEDIVDEDKEREEDDEKETEERDSKEKDNQVEEENSLEDHDHDEDSSSSHEAREEHYKADDASSAVTHDTGVTNTENESGKSEQQAEHVVDQSSTTLKVEDAKMEGVDSLKATNNEEKNDDPISSVSNSTRMEGLTDNSESASHSIEVSTQTHDLLLQKGTETVTQEHDVTVKNTTSGGSNLSVGSSQQNSNSADMVDNNQIDSNSIFSLKNDGVDSTPVDSSSMSGDTESSLAEKVDQGNATVEDNVELPLKDDNPTEVQKADTSDEIGTTDEDVDASISENLEEVQDDPIDTSDSSIHLEEKHIRTDLETLPEIQTEGSSMEDAAAE